MFERDHGIYMTDGPTRLFEFSLDVTIAFLPIVALV